MSFHLPPPRAIEAGRQRPCIKAQKEREKEKGRERGGEQRKVQCANAQGTAEKRQKEKSNNDERSVNR